MVGQVNFSITYGIATAPRNDPNIALAEAALEGVDVAQTKGRIFNLVPFCKSNQSLLQFDLFLLASAECPGVSHALAVVVPGLWF